MNSTDQNLFFDQTSNKCNIMGVIVLEKTNEQTLRDVFGKRAPNLWYRLRCKMVKILDRYYFKEMDEIELET